MKFIFVILLVVAISTTVFFLVRAGDKTSLPFMNKGEVSWDFDFNSKRWQVRGNPPICPNPLVFSSPVDVSLVSGILYPGQERGGDYKPHGGFRFDNRDTNKVEVRAIMDGAMIKASRYLEVGEEQVLLFYVNDCGIMVKHDHLLTLSPRLKTILDKIPLGKEGDSRTTNIEPKVYIKKGEVLATEVGFRNFNSHKNVSVDYGLYDLRTTNGVNYDSSFRSRFPLIDENGMHALCWLNYLEEPEKSIVKGLPGADGENGTQSDYCK